MTLIARVLEALSAALIGVAALAALTGGWQMDLMGATISVRALWRPLVLAAFFAAFRWRMIIRHSPSVVQDLSDATARMIAGAALVAGVLAWFTFLSPTVGGSDSYGYASAANRIRNGSLIEVEPLAAILPFDNPVAAAAPLGYVPTPRDPQASVPSYPLGLPLMMAIAASIFGDSAIFLVAPVMSALALAAAYWISRRWFGDTVLSLATVAALSIYPFVFAYAIQPMSDMPAAACFLVAAACLTTTRPWVAGVGGLAAALAFWTRPALAPGLFALALMPLVDGDKRRIRVIAYAIPFALAIAAQAWLHWYLYGDVRASGYGRSDDLFSAAHLTTNARIYGTWGLLANGWIWLGGLIFAPWTSMRHTTWAVLIAVVFGALVPYAIYRPYDHWETLRFILPTLIVLSMLSMAGWSTRARQRSMRVWGATRPALARVLATWVFLAIAGVMMFGWVGWLDEQRVFQLVRQEERYRLAGQMVERVTPPNAVILTSLHSGSLRYYAHRDTVDWAEIPKESFVLTVATLRLKERPVFVLLDGDEERKQFETLHGNALIAWLPHGQRRNLRLYESPP